MKVEYVRNPTRSYKVTLQYITAEVASTRRVAFDSGTGTCDVSATYTHQWNCHNQGTHTNDGSSFIGTYDANKWQHEYVKPPHQDIMQDRSNDGGGNLSWGQKRRSNAIKIRNISLFDGNRQVKITDLKGE